MAEESHQEAAALVVPAAVALEHQAGESTVVQYHFPVEVEVRAAPEPEPAPLLAEQAIADLARDLAAG